MIVIASTGYFPWTMDFKDGETIDQLVQRMKDENSLRFKTGYFIQETQTGRTLDGAELAQDDTRYNLVAWVVSA